MIVLAIVAIVAIIVYASLQYYYTSVVFPKQLATVQALIAEKNNESAKELISRLLLKDKNNPSLKWYKAKIEIEQGQYILAIVTLNDLIQTDHFNDEVTSDQVRQELARIYERSGRIKEAVTEYFILLEKDPVNFEANLKVGEYYLSIQNNEDAINYLKAAHIARKTDIRAPLALAKLYLKQNNLNEAEKMIRIAQQNDKLNPEIAFVAGQIHMLNLNFNLAADQLQKSTVIQSPFKHEAGALSAICHSQLKNDKEAISLFETHLNKLQIDSDLVQKCVIELTKLYERGRHYKELEALLASYNQNFPNSSFISEKKEIYKFFFLYPKLNHFLSMPESEIIVRIKKMLEKLGYVIDEATRMREKETTVYIRIIKYGKGVQKSTEAIFLALAPEVTNAEHLANYNSMMKKDSARIGYVLTPFTFHNDTAMFIKSVPIVLWSGEEFNKLINGQNLF